MIFKYNIRLIAAKNYITGWRLISEDRVPSEEYEFTKPLSELLRDENDRFQWTIQDNPDYDPEVDHIDDRYIIGNDPIPLTPEELQAKQEAQGKADYIAVMPDLVKTLETRIAILETTKEITL